MARETPGDFKFQQNAAHSRGRGARQPHKIVDRYGGWPEQRDETAALVCTRFGIPRAERFLGWFLCRRQNKATAKDRLDRRDHVARFGDRSRLA